MRTMISLALLLLGISSRAEAQHVLDFSTIPHGFLSGHEETTGEWDIPEGFGGFKWVGFRAADSNYTSANWGFFFDDGLITAGPFAEFSARDPFRLLSFFAGADRDPYEVARVDGYLDGTLVHSTFFGLPVTFSDINVIGPDLHTFDGWLVDRVAFTTSGPIEAKLGLSQITVAATPEPASMALIATGLFGVGAVRWRRKRRTVA
jgi:hypothetical protein